MTDTGAPTPEQAARDAFWQSPYPHLRVEPVVHPRQKLYLRELSGPTPLIEGAEELLWEAIGEYDSAFGRPYRKPTPEEGRRTVPFTMHADLPHDGEEHVYLAGKVHTLSMRFQGQEELVEPTDDIFTHFMVIVRDRNMEGSRIWPDWLRYVPIDQNGNSRNTRFLLDIPDRLKGYNSALEVSVLNGTRTIVDFTEDMRFR